MNKPYLLIAGLGYYPESGMGDWIGCFKTREEAASKIITRPVEPEVFKSGPRKGQIKPDSLQSLIKEDYFIDGIQVEWYEIVDLRKWTEV